jgi:AraC-like DNA-binding protein
VLTLQQLFRDKLIPWAENNLEQRLVVARPVMKRAHLPEGFEISPFKFIGKRVLVRNRRNAGYRLYYAEWPEDHLHELTAPKLICVLKGVTDYIAGKYTITCGEGNFILLPAFTPNVANDYPPSLEGERRKIGYCEHLQILLGRDNIGCMYSIHTTEGARHVEGVSCSVGDIRAMRLFQDFIDLAQESEHHHPQLQQHLLSAFFWAMFHELDAGHEFYSAFKDSHISSSKKTADELRDYVKANLRHVLTIEKVARHLYMSPRQFTRYLRQETGRSFVEILTECRIEESKRFLTETSWTIDGIAWMVGFKSADYFSTFFSRHVGCSPGVYRKKNPGKK